LQTNYYGLLNALNAFLPLIRDGGRVVNLGSMAGLLTRYSSSVQQRFLSALTVPQVTAIMEDFQKAVKAGK